MRDKRAALRVWAGLLLALSFPVVSAGAEEPVEVAADVEPQAAPRHRFDLGGNFFDTEEGQIATGLLSYTWIARPSHAFSLTLPFVGAKISETEGSGIGDLVAQYSWVPSVELDANPWFPRSMGIGLTLILPSGDSDKGIGDDRWVAIPNLGWVVPINRRFSFLPLLQYVRSFDEMSEEDDLELVNLELGLTYVSPGGFWVNYTPSIFEDLGPSDDNDLDHSLTLGKQFRLFGVSLQVATIERPDREEEVSGPKADYLISLTFHFTLR